ncbi:hypothetical protein BC829DRAFT_447660 [Chytridium lagenaria]|nr:hypothetical protein BC829DRAFT_447660 [Chytridium lagenaria]
MHDFVLGLRHVDGKHSGSNFARIFLRVLADFNVGNGLIFITADNAATNTTMAQEIEKTHVINLAAKQGLSLLGEGSSGDLEDEQTDVMDLAFILSEEDGATVNVKSLLKRLHAFVVFVNASPQRRQLLTDRIELKQPTVFANNVRGLRPVRTRSYTGPRRLRRVQVSGNDQEPDPSARVTA